MKLYTEILDNKVGKYDNIEFEWELIDAVYTVFHAIVSKNENNV